MPAATSLPVVILWKITCLFLILTPQCAFAGVHLSIKISIFLSISLSHVWQTTVRQATVQGADHSKTGQGVLTGEGLVKLCLRLYRRACVFISRHKSRQCVPKGLTGSLATTPTLLELRFKAWHKNKYTKTHKQKNGLLAVSS